MSKKGLLGLLFLLLAAGVTYVYFSGKKVYTTQKKVTSAEDCIRRHFTNKVLWSKWCAGKKLNDSTFTDNGINYTITKILFNGFHLIISKKNDSLQGIVYFESIKEPSKSILYFSTIEKQNNGLLERYKSANRIKKFENAISVFMNTIEEYFNSQQKIYGFDVKMERTTDFNLLVYKQELKQEPTVQEIYKAVEKIDTYIKSKNGEIKNPPMLNIFEDAPQVYYVMVAIPTKKAITGTSEIVYKQLVEGNILTAEIKGGPFTIKQAEKEMRNYVQDNKKVSPAIPYQSLITNRLSETDTTKWVTKLYYPVFY